MPTCKVCNGTVSHGIHLSDGGMVHTSCVESLAAKLSRSRDELSASRDKLYRLENELKRRESLVFKISFLFSKSKATAADIEDGISVTRNTIAQIRNRAKAIYLKLSPIYDFYLNYPPDWEIRREAVNRRDGDSCYVCRKTRNLHLHHKIPLSRGGSNKTSNLQLLCERCHSKQHGGRDFSGDFTNSETAFSKRVSTIRLAIQDGSRLQFLYKKPRQSYRKRTIKPTEFNSVAHLSGDGQTLCVLGYCELRKANRHFAVKRMKCLTIM